MPKIRPDLAKSVFFLYWRNPKKPYDPTHPERGLEGPLGTGFFVRRHVLASTENIDIPTPQPSVHYYAITNRHVAIRDGATVIRINRKDGSTRLLELDLEDWYYLESGDDICAADIDTKTIEWGKDDVAFIPEYVFLTQAEMNRYEVGIGENAFMVGLFVSHHGGKKNIRSARFGNISMLADDAAPIETESGFTRPCHIVDMRSRSGFSGSPVFIYRTPTDDLTFIPQNRTYMEFLAKTSILFRLFGVHCAQFDERLDVKRAPKPPAVKEGVGSLFASGISSPSRAA
jgi:hypothetical protein